MALAGAITEMWAKDVSTRKVDDAAAVLRGGLPPLRLGLRRVLPPQRQAGEPVHRDGARFHRTGRARVGAYTDNMASVVKGRDAYGRPVWNAQYAAFMSFVGFRTRLCRQRIDTNLFTGTVAGHAS